MQFRPHKELEKDLSKPHSHSELIRGLIFRNCSLQKTPFRKVPIFGNFAATRNSMATEDLLTKPSQYSVTKMTTNDKSVPWGEAFKEGIQEFPEVGLMLKGSRSKSGLTQKELATRLGIRPHHISEMEHGKRAISKNMALKLGKIFDVDYKVFL